MKKEEWSITLLQALRQAPEEPHDTALNAEANLRFERLSEKANILQEARLCQKVSFNGASP